MADINIVQTKRYHIPGMQNYDGQQYQFIEGPKKNNKTIKMNIKRTYVIKRPLLNSYETNLTEKQIYTQYYEAQKGLYLRFMAWPEDMSFFSNLTGLSGVSGMDTSNPNIPVVTDTGTTRLGNGLQVQMYKKAYFKLDENTATF